MERFEKKKIFYIGKSYELQSHGASVDICKYLDLNSDEWSDFICQPMVTWHFNSIYIEYSA